MRTDLLSTILKWISRTILNAERALLDLLGALVPYTVSLIPASLVYNSAIRFMDFDPRIALAAGFSVEVLGVTAIHTGLRFYQWNKTHNANREQAPLYIPIAAYLMYAILTTALNVVMEIYAGERPAPVIVAIALFNFLALPSALLISARSLHGEMLEDKAEREAEARQARREAKQQARRGYMPQPAPVFGSETDRPELTEVKPAQGGLFQRKKRGA